MSEFKIASLDLLAISELTIEMHLCGLAWCAVAVYISLSSTILLYYSVLTFPHVV